MRKSKEEQSNLKMLENELELTDVTNVKGGIRQPLEVSRPTARTDRGGTPMRAGNGNPIASNPTVNVAVVRRR